jgi:acid phosphatase
MRSVVMSQNTSSWDSLQWRRRLERFGPDDGPIIAAGAGGQVDGICQLGELTDQGRETTYALGERLRHLYVDQLKFMPPLIANADLIYLRATPMPRALESVQQSFWGMYPLTARTASFPAPTIVTRTPADETLFPNDSNCRRFAQLGRMFAQRTADRHNDTEDMRYLTKQIGRWMPDTSKEVAVDSHPRLSGIMDTINSTLAHGPETRLPKEFYDKKMAAIIDRIAVEEWFSGYTESREYRKLGIGPLAGDIVERMISKVEGAGLSINEIGGENGQLGLGRGGEKGILFAMSGCHDTTLAALLTSLGAFDGEKWPPYTSHVAVELFRKKAADAITPVDPTSRTAPKSSTEKQAEESQAPARPGFLSSMLGLSSSASSAQQPRLNNASTIPQPGAQTQGIARRPWSEIPQHSKDKLSGYYVRLRFNDKVMTVPACKRPGNHLEGDESFCTLETFKRVVDGYTPKNWKMECGMRLGEGAPGISNAKGAGPDEEEREWAGEIEVGS